MSKYEDIAIKIKERITKGEFDENKKLPTERQLMTEYSSSKNTIRSAINLLVNAGLLFPIHGSGIYIRPNLLKGTIRLSNTRGFASEHPGRKLRRSILDFNIIECDIDLAKKLECDIGVLCYYIKRIMYIDDLPFAVEYTYYNKDIVPFLNKDIAKKSIFSFIINDLKLSIGFSEKYISSSPLIEEDRQLLELESSAFGLIVDDNTYLSNGKKFNYSRICYNYKYANLFNSDK